MHIAMSTTIHTQRSQKGSRRANSASFFRNASIADAEDESTRLPAYQLADSASSVGAGMGVGEEFSTGGSGARSYDALGESSLTVDSQHCATKSFWALVHVSVPFSTEEKRWVYTARHVDIDPS